MIVMTQAILWFKEAANLEDDVNYGILKSSRKNPNVHSYLKNLVKQGDKKVE